MAESNIILYDKDGLVIYSYQTITNLTKYGYKIYVNEHKTELSYECSGFDSYENAEKSMNLLLAFLSLAFD